MPSVAVFAELLDDLVVLSQLVFIDATAIGDVLIHLHIPCGMGQPGCLPLALPPIKFVPVLT